MKSEPDWKLAGDPGSDDRSSLKWAGGVEVVVDDYAINGLNMALQYG